ncbi:hypothetical protein N658DRAFT_538347 [Parathielavia hyrcaniae]|uniref:Uncharacterized protein n=1 Tax=Parathielavia hyrcaniae TaxID=113614 RepID=A0AAN6QCW5_9PEZI|nr:hypothetical protein N658DRAFT_538347 [Parathielavia hyrcaniae]
MAPSLSVGHCPVEREAPSDRLCNSQWGLVKSEQRRQLPTEGLHQLVLSEVLDDGSTRPLECGGGRAVAVACVLDLGLRMLESGRGRDALENLARKAICVWRERPVPGPVMEPWNVDIPTAVDEFLRCVRHSFPSVKIDDRNGFCHEEGNATVPCSWVDEHSAMEQSDFNPKSAAALHLNWQLVDKLYWARLKADVALRQRREDERLAETARFHRLQFHLGAMVTHHLCHLFVNFLRAFGDLAYDVTDADMLRLVRRYDPGAEFEVDFFGGRPKLFMDRHAPREESYPGRSFVIKRARNGGRMAAVVAQYRIESYLKGDFAVPLLTEVEGDIFLMERYQDVLRRFGGSRHESCQWREGQTGTRRVAQAGSSDQQTPGSVPWDIQGAEYRLLKRACFDPAIRLVDLAGF